MLQENKGVECGELRCGRKRGGVKLRLPFSCEGSIVIAFVNKLIFKANDILLMMIEKNRYHILGLSLTLEMGNILMGMRVSSVFLISGS